MFKLFGGIFGDKFWNNAQVPSMSFYPDLQGEFSKTILIKLEYNQDKIGKILNLNFIQFFLNNKFINFFMQVLSYTANVYRELQGLYREMGVQGFKSYGD